MVVLLINHQLNQNKVMMKKVREHESHKYNSKNNQNVEIEIEKESKRKRKRKEKRKENSLILEQVSLFHILPLILFLTS